MGENHRCAFFGQNFDKRISGAKVYAFDPNYRDTFLSENE